MQNESKSGLPEAKPVLPEEDPTLFLGAMAARAMRVEDPVLQKSMLRDLFFQVQARGGAAGAAAYYQPAVFGGLESDALELTAKGDIRPTIRNFALILQQSACFRTLRFNRFKGCFEENGRPWSDDDLSRAMAYIESEYHIKSRDDFFHALNLLKPRIGYHPVLERIAAIQWDGCSRLAGFFPKLLGCADTPYTRELGRLLFHCGMARLMEPGCKVDCVLILTGRQGSGKSTLVRMLALEDDWFTEISDIRDEKKVGEQLRGKWFAELGELNAFRTSLEEVKQFATRQYDRYRLAYDRLAQDYPRTCIFIGTTNNPRPLRDRTGNRRFFPVEITVGGDWLHEAKEGVMPYIEQCWAEVYALGQKGKLRPYVTRGLEADVAREQEKALQDDTRVGDIERYLSDPAHPVDVVCIKQIWQEALGMTEGPPRRQSDFIAAVLDNLPGWKRGDSRIGKGSYRNQLCWVRET